ncbi:MFS transporter [Alkalicoccobacillus plakortidis]|uniref:MFS transporter n=1 Tax=Alkalicoccobacillus plakortidis TaxID=444060 RepID=UPI00358DCFB3
MYMQGALAFTAIATGLVMLPGGLINGAMSPIMGRLFDKFGPRPILIPGTILLAITVFTYRFSTPGVPIWVIILQHSFLMISIAMIMMPSQTNGLNQLPTKLYPHGTAIASTLMQVSGAIGAALFIAILENGQQNYLADINNPTDLDIADALTVGSQLSFSTGFYFACAAVVLALLVRRSKQEKLK